MIMFHSAFNFREYAVTHIYGTVKAMKFNKVDNVDVNLNFCTGVGARPFPLSTRLIKFDVSRNEV